MKERRERTTKEVLEGLTLDDGIREKLRMERYPAASVDGDYAEPDDPDTRCIDGAGNEWPEHDESGFAECRRCGAELDMRCPGCGNDSTKGTHGQGNGYGGCV